MIKPPQSARWRGFTLIEMLVVVLIIGMLVVGAILTLGTTGRDSQLEQERDRLQALIDYTRDRGTLMTTEYGIRCGEHGYRFVYYDNLTMQWLPETLDDTLRMRRLPKGLDLQLVIEGRPIVLDDKALQFDPGAAVPPPALGGVPSIPGITGAAGVDPSGGASGNSNGAADSGGNSGLGAPATFTTPVADNTPQIMLFSNGDTNSFALTIERTSARRSVTIQNNPDGSISVSRIVEASP